MTSRDREIVRWIGRLRMASAAQVAERFGVGRTVGYARLNGLVHAELLDHKRIFHEAPGVYVATRTGLRVAGLTFPPARVDLRTYEHDLGLSSLTIELEREFGEERIVSEREMRASDVTVGHASIEGPWFGIPVAGGPGQTPPTPPGRGRLHFADSAVAFGDRVSQTPILAVELERTAKGTARLRRILSGYIASREVREVRYYTATDRTHALVRREVDRLSAGSLIDVRRVSPEDETLARAASL